MKIVAEYDFNGGKASVLSRYFVEFSEIKHIIASVDANMCKTKESHEKTMPGRILFSPRELNDSFKKYFSEYGWTNHKEYCDYQYGNFLEGYEAADSHNRPYRDMDFVKPGVKLGIELQLGKYAFMVYNVCAKMTIFRNKGIIDTGIEIVPVKHLADEMSTGVSYFEQIAWDLHERGVSNIDVPVYILGIDA